MLSWQYIAGFFDGEGSVMVSSNTTYSFTPHLSVCQSGERGRILLLAIKDFLEREGIKTNRLYDTSRNPAQDKKWKTLYSLRCSESGSVKIMLQKMFPYLHIKKVESQDMLRMLTLFPKRQKVTRWNKRRVA
jgi:hypothetical protein